MLHKMHLKTNKKEEMLDIAPQVQKLLAQENIREGMAVGRESIFVNSMVRANGLFW